MGKSGYIFVSPSEGQPTLNVNEAAKFNHEQYLHVSKQILNQLHADVKKVTSNHGVGAYTGDHGLDTWEPSQTHHISLSKPNLSVLKAAAASVGQKHNQSWVLLFVPHNKYSGLQSMFNVNSTMYTTKLDVKQIENLPKLWEALRKFGFQGMSWLAYNKKWPIQGELKVVGPNISKKNSWDLFDNLLWYLSTKFNLDKTPKITMMRGTSYAVGPDAPSSHMFETVKDNYENLINKINKKQYSMKSPVLELAALAVGTKVKPTKVRYQADLQPTTAAWVLEFYLRMLARNMFHPVMFR